MHNNKAHTLLYYIKSLNCLTIMRDLTERDAFKALYSMLTAILNSDYILAEMEYHALTEQLIAANADRVSGNIFKDFILDCIVTHENEFSVQAAKGKSDVVLNYAMQSDIRALLSLANITTDELAGYMNGSMIGSNDRISELSSAVWSGRDVGNSNIQNKSLPRLECNLIPWSYNSDPGDVCSYNPLLINVYDSLLSGYTDDIIDVLWNFYNSCGTGMFIKNNCFMSDATNILYPINDLIRENELLPFLYSDEYNKLQDIIASFGNGESEEHTVLYGVDGLGKTTMLLSAAEAEKQLVTIYISAYSMPNMTELFKKLEYQPMRFAVIIDDAQSCVELPRLLSPVLCPENVIIIAATDCDSQLNYFGSMLILTPPDPTMLTKYICDISFNEASADTIRNVCTDYQIETKRALSYNAVKAILRRL